jgi:hypothetical protein
MQIRNQEVYLCYGKSSEYIEELDAAAQGVVAQGRKICTLISQGGTGKSALTQYWRDKGSRFLRPNDILIVPLVPAKDAYKSPTHMLYACLLNAVQKHSPPAYVPRRLLRRYNSDYLGKKNIEALRKDIVTDLGTRLIDTIVFDSIEHLDKPALYAALGFRGHYALIFSGQRRSAPDDKQLTAWLDSLTDAKEAWRHAIELQRPTWQELRGSKEQRGLIRELLEEHVRATVPPNEQRESVNRRLGSLLIATHRDWGSIARLIALIDDYTEAQTGRDIRHITHRTIDRIINKLRLIDPTAVQAVVEEDKKNASQQDKQPEQGKRSLNVLSLNEEQRATLEQIRDTHEKPAVCERATAILLFATGTALNDIASSCLKPKNVETVRGWINRYRTEGIAGLETRPGQGRKPQNTKDTEAVEAPK